MAFAGEDLAHAVIGILEECEDLLAALAERQLTTPEYHEYHRATSKKVADMKRWVQENRRATERQEETAFHWRDGIQRWLDSNP